MKKILIGYALILEIIPSAFLSGNFSYLLYARVLGALLLYFGFKELKTESHHIGEVSDLTLLLAIVTFLLVTVEVVNRALLSSMLIYLLDILIDVALFFITYKFILGVHDLELKHNTPLQHDKLLLAFLYMVVLYIAQLIFSFEPVHAAALIGYTLCKLFFIYRMFILMTHSKNLNHLESK